MCCVCVKEWGVVPVPGVATGWGGGRIPLGNIVRVTGGGRELHRETRGLYRKSYKAMLTL